MRSPNTLRSKRTSMVAEIVSIHLPRFKTEAMTWNVKNKNTFKVFYAKEVVNHQNNQLCCDVLNVLMAK